MSEAKFTKGEWIAFYPHEIHNSGHVSVENEEGRQICISEVYKSNLDEGTANVRLIAAAPEMYDLLNSIENDADRIPTFLWDKIQSVLAKARGDN